MKVLAAIAVLFAIPSFTSALYEKKTSDDAPVEVCTPATDLACHLAFEKKAPYRELCPSVIRVALVGSGNFARKAHLPSLIEELGDCAELKFIWSRSMSGSEHGEARHRELSSGREATSSPKVVWGEDGFKEILESDVQLLDVVLPIKQQPKYVMDALKKGKFVISEKPAAPGSSEVNKMELAAVEGRTRWMVAENWRFETPFRVVGRALKAGAIGEPVLFSATAVGEVPDSHPLTADHHWRMKDNSSWIVDVGVHMIAALRTAFDADAYGSPRVRPKVGGVTASKTRKEFYPFDSFAAALSFMYEKRGVWNGTVPGSLVFSLSSSRLAPKDPDVDGLSNMDLHITGTEGSLLATRGRVELRDKEGKEIQRLDGLSEHSVSWALRAACLEVIEEREFLDPEEVKKRKVDFNVEILKMHKEHNEEIKAYKKAKSEEHKQMRERGEKVDLHTVSEVAKWEKEQKEAFAQHTKELRLTKTPTHHLPKGSPGRLVTADEAIADLEVIEAIVREGKNFIKAKLPVQRSEARMGHPYEL